MLCSDIKINEEAQEIRYFIEEECFRINIDDYIEHKEILPLKNSIVSEEVLEKILSLDLKCFLIRKGLSKLMYSDNTKKGLLRKLMQEKYRGGYPSSDEAVQAVLYLSKKGYINEKDFCERITLSYYKKLYGERKIRDELRKKGFSEKMANYTLEKMNLDFSESCLSLYNKKMHTSNPDEKKVFASLYRSGYSYDLIKNAAAKFNETR